MRAPYPDDRFKAIIGRSPSLLAVFALIDDVAASEANILIEGASGTGKELIANAIHSSSARAGGPFIKINSAAIPGELIESELFGYVRGAFSGATVDKRGLLELADGGSLLLDEIGEMPNYLQTKLLRVLQEREFRPIGGGRIIHVDFRLITATNSDIEEAKRAGRVREDLYYRINTIVMRVPTLAARADDIPLLCQHFLEKYRALYDKRVQEISPEAYALLVRNPWPGNVRELEHAIERAVLVCKQLEIMPVDLPESLREPAAKAGQKTLSAEATGGPFLPKLSDRVKKHTVRAEKSIH